MTVKERCSSFLKRREINFPLRFKPHTAKANTEHKSVKKSAYRWFVSFKKRQQYPLREESGLHLMGAWVCLGAHPKNWGKVKSMSRLWEKFRYFCSHSAFLLRVLVSQPKKIKHNVIQSACHVRLMTEKFLIGHYYLASPVKPYYNIFTYHVRFLDINKQRNPV